MQKRNNNTETKESIICMHLIDFCKRCEHFKADYSNRPGIDGNGIEKWFDCKKFKATHCDHKYFVEALIDVPYPEYVGYPYADLIRHCEKTCPHIDKMKTFFKLQYLMETHENK